LVSPTSAAKPQQQPDPATGQYPSSKTVKSLLDSSRQQKIVPGISTATMVPVYPASGIPKVCSYEVELLVEELYYVSDPEVVCPTQLLE
jgi:hypothetical protein